MKVSSNCGLGMAQLITPESMLYQGKLRVRLSRQLSQLDDVVANAPRFRLTYFAFSPRCSPRSWQRTTPSPLSLIGRVCIQALTLFLEQKILYL